MSIFDIVAARIVAAVTAVIALIMGAPALPTAPELPIEPPVVMAERIDYGANDVVFQPPADDYGRLISGDVIPSGLNDMEPEEPVDPPSIATSPKKAVEPRIEPPPPPPPAAPAVPTLLQEFPFDLSWKDAVVNIFCMNRYGGYEYSGGGSGVIVDPRGIILTNAHVAWPNLLFHEWPEPSLYQCTVRTGSPAKPMYTARVLYLPPEYMQTSYELQYDYQKEEKWIYGKNDYAFLLITGRTDPSASLPAAFPYLPVYTGEILGEGSFIYDVGYPAGYLGGMTMQTSLGQAASPTRIFQRRSIIGTTEANVFSYLADIAGQAGSSGGPVIKAGGEVMGLNTFVEAFAANTSEQILYAVSTHYIDQDLRRDTGMGIKDFLAAGDFAARSQKFLSEYGDKYRRLLVDSWKKNQDIIIPGVTY